MLENIFNCNCSKITTFFCLFTVFENWMESMIGDHVKSIYKCRKCRHFLLADNQVSNCHGYPISSDENDSKSCSPVSNVWYLTEDRIPAWMKNQVDDGNWTKGKLFCPTCQCRIGSYDFVSGAKCSCGSHVLPPLHVVSSKLDCESKRRPQVLSLSDVVIENSEA